MGPMANRPSLGESSLRFNLAHAGDRAALAVARDREVGVDLEPIDPCLDVLPLLAIACSETEAARIAALAPGARVEAFLTCWTLKESYLKGIGTGLSRDPRTVEIALLPDDRAVATDHLVGIHGTTLERASPPPWFGLGCRGGCSRSVAINRRVLLAAVGGRRGGWLRATRTRIGHLAGDAVALSGFSFL